jgi:hypothetical protein
MTRVMMDHFRRWWWVLALAGLLEFRLGWSIANRPQDTFEFWAFMLSLWAGANLLLFDFKRGSLGAVAALPLTSRQFGRSWWLATVPFPAMGLAAMLFLGAGAFCLVHPSRAFPTTSLALGSLFTLVWLGNGFPMIFAATRGLARSLWQMTCTFFLSALSVLMLFGSMLWAQGASKNPFKCAVLLGIGGFLTLVGWVEAERFDIGRAAQYFRGRFEVPALGRNRLRSTPLEPKMGVNPHPVEPGYGGVPFLVLSRVVRMFGLLAAMSALTALLWIWRGSAIPEHTAIVIFAGTGSMMSWGFMLVFQLLPVLRQLRLLRTMPLSVMGLSITLIAIMLLPLIALGAVSAAVAGVALGTPAALTFLSDYIFALAPTSLCVFLAVWLGEGKLAYAGLIVVFFGSQQVQLRLQSFRHIPELPLGLATAIAATCILLALLLTSWALRYGGHAYHSRTISPGDYPLGLGS